MWVLIVLFIVGFIYLFNPYRFKYWEIKGVKTFPSPSIPWGHLKSPFDPKTTNLGVYLKEYYEYFRKQGEAFGGLYMCSTPVFMPVDPTLVKRVLLEDFNYFDEKGLYYHEKAQPISAHLFEVGGDKWRRMRQKLTPNFSSGKLKGMFPIIQHCNGPMMKYIANNPVLNMKKVFANYTMDVIGNCAFGIQVNCFDNPSAKFYLYGRKIFATDSKRSLIRVFRLFFPSICYKLNVVNHPRDVEQFFTEIVKETVALREEGKVPFRNDFIDLFLELKKNGTGITLQDIITESFLFFAAGFETSSSTMGHMVFEVAQQHEIQVKLKEEIDRVLNKYNGVITYEMLKELTYMQKVIDETLRKYPPVPMFNRECSKDYKIPGTDVIIEKGTKVVVPSFAIHRDEEYFPDPEKFDPERFSPENIQSRPGNAWMGFGMGPRLCIAMRFAHVQMKVALVTIFNIYYFKLHESMNKQLSFDKAHILNCKEQILVHAIKWEDSTS